MKMWNLNVVRQESNIEILRKRKISLCRVDDDRKI